MRAVSASLARALGGVAGAYGYTLTTSTTLAVLVGVHGTPSTGQLFAFAFGGVSGYALLERLTSRSAGGATPGVTAAAGALSFFAVAAGLAAGDAAGHLHSGAAWALAPLAATACYFPAVAVQSALVGRR